uniref:Putative splicing regulator n=1 Tax=Corethrella appendiculata TaxID=1370023 RepID=U5EJB7_9DIPT
MKKINEQKLQAFTTGAMGKRPLSRKEIEEQKKREEEAAAATAFKEFVETFQEAPSKLSKVWVKAGTYDAGTRKEDTREKGKLYKPQSRHEQDDKNDYVKLLSSSDAKKEALSLKNKKSQEKKKSNLELFKEELRQIQEEREERHKYKSMAKQLLPTSNSSEPDLPIVKEVEMGSFDNGDPNTTNLYLGNLNPKISEQQLMELFGKHGPLASIKIMWPRSDEEKARGRNCGFVAYMSRRDAERALRSLNGKDVMGYEMKLGWGKSVPIMTHPIYIPPTLVEYALPPPTSGLPFNAQAHPNDSDNLPKVSSKMYLNDEEARKELDDVLFKSIVKVVIPTERPLLMLIHRMIEFVIREGPMFEALIMTREMENPMFRFLFDNESPAHIYYRWKLFSLLQGDTPAEWRLTEFRMFKNGSIWKPPPTNFYTQGMPDELIAEEDIIEPNKGALSVAQRDRLEMLLRYITPERQKIGDAMIFCIEHADAADEICECISESLVSNETLVHKKIARLYLVSDILHNCSVKVQNASFFRKSMEKNLLEIFKNLNNYYMSVESRLKAEGFKSRVMQVFKAWEEWVVYPRDFLNKLQNIFLGLPIVEKEDEEIEEEKEDEDLDGIPLDGAALLKSAMLRGISESGAEKSPLSNEDDDVDDEDIDGMPLDEDIDGIPLDISAPGYDPSKPGGSEQTGSFIPSKWETIDAEQVEAQAITTSKWETLDPVAPEPPKISSIYDDDDMSTVSEEEINETEEERRTRLREIEVKLMQYQDEIESGKRSIKSGWTVQQQLEHYRKKLIKKSERDIRTFESDSDIAYAASTTSSKKSVSRRSVSPVDISRTTKHKRSKRSRSSSPEYVKSPAVRSSSKHHRSRSPLAAVSSSKSRRISISPPAISSHHHQSSSSSTSQQQHSSRSGKSSKRKSRTPSISPKRYVQYVDVDSPARTSSASSKYDKYDKYEKYDKYDKYDKYAQYESKYESSSSSKYESSKYESSSSKYDASPRRYRSPTPPSSSRSSSRRSTRDVSPYKERYHHRESSSRSDKHKKHKY